MKINAGQIITLLENKHWQEVFISECKTGPSPCLRLDGWAMNKSWANATATGYEVKVSRSDFMNDKKWMGYLKYCNEFYFVAPAGIISPDEVPEQAGLYLVSKTGTKLFKKKKSPYRDIEIPESIYMYIMMNRVQVARGYYVKKNRSERIEQWEEWLNTKHKAEDIGYKVSDRIRKLIKEIKRERDSAIDDSENFQAIENRLMELGHDPKTHISGWQLDRRMDELLGGIPDSFKSNLKNASEDLNKVVDMLDKIENKD